MKENINEMETMDIQRLAIKTSIPMVISMISIALYGIIDSMFVAGISEKALTAITLAYPIQNIITSIGLGTGIGINSLLARTLGEKNKEKVQKIMANGISLTVIIWILIAIIFGLISKPILGLFSEDIKLINMGASYLIILSIFSIGTLFQITTEKILEAYGKTKESMIIQIVGSVINLVLDPIFIFGFLCVPAFGIIGAGIATVIGQIVGMVIGLIYLKKYNLTMITKEDFMLDKQIVKDIYKVGVPTIVLEIVSSFIMLWINKILIGYTESAVSAWGVYGKIDKFVLITVCGLNYGMIPIIAYNLGAKRLDRVKESIKFFMKLNIGVTIIGTLVTFFGGELILKAYKVSEETLKIGVPAFKILAFSFIFAGINFMGGAIFQAYGNATYSLIIKLLRKLLISMPIIYIFKDMFGLDIIWWSFVIAEAVTFIIVLGLLKYTESRMNCGKDSN